MPKEKRDRRGPISRRRFIQLAAMLTVGGRTLWSSGDARAAVAAARDALGGPDAWPAMP